MRKRTLVGVAVGLAVLLVAGGLYASNVGFKLNYALLGAPNAGSQTGQNTIALPFNQQTNLTTAFELIQDINATGPGAVIQVTKFTPANDGGINYTGTSGSAFPLVPGEGYLVQVTADVPYIIVGSHNPGLVIDVLGPDGGAAVGGLSQTGQNLYAYPYHSIAANAGELINEINAAAGASAVIQVTQFTRNNDGGINYTGTSGTAFPLVPGQAYYIQVSQDVSFVPAHY